MKAADLLTVIPELILLSAACAAVLTEAFLKPYRVADSAGPEGRERRVILAIVLAGLAAAAGASLGLVGVHREAFGGMLSLDEWAAFFRVLFCAGGAITVLMSPAYLKAHDRHLGEYYALVLFAVIGMDLMTAARDLVLFYVSLELMAMSSYLLAAFFRYRVRSNESSLKYFLTGSFASAVTLYGISLAYGLTGSTSFQGVAQALARVGGPAAAGSSSGVIFAVFLVAVGLAFKVSAAPFHMWTPDVYQGAPTPIAAFFSVGPKVAGLAVLISAFVTAFSEASREWGLLFIVLSIVTMVVGNVYALVQTNVKRMLAYSSIAHAGYLLTGLGAIGWTGEPRAGYGMLMYVAAYTFTNLGAFGVLAYLKTQSSDQFDYSLKHLAGLGRRSAWSALLLSLFLLSLTGIPGTAGFIGKFYVFGGVIWAGLWWLAVIGVLLSAVSAYYYLRVIVYMFFKEPAESLSGRAPLSVGMSVSLGLSAFATLAIGLVPSWLWDAAVSAYHTLLP